MLIMCTIEYEKKMYEKSKEYFSNVKKAIHIDFSSIESDDDVLTNFIQYISEMGILLEKKTFDSISILEICNYDLIILNGISPTKFVDFLRNLTTNEIYEKIISKLIVGFVDDRIFMQKNLGIKDTSLNQESFDHQAELLREELHFNKEDFELENAIIKAFEKLYLNDHYLIDNTFLLSSSDNDRNEKHYVGERAIVFRFAHYLQSLLESSERYSAYVVDCEYNRNKWDEKSTEHFPNGTFPDIIVHRRGTNKYNLLILEFKTYWNRDNKRDIVKIKDFISSTGEYHFKYGLAVTLEKERPDIFRVKENEE